MKKSVRYTSIVLVVLLIGIFLIVQKLFFDDNKTSIKENARPNMLLSLNGIIVKPVNFSDKIITNGTLLADETVDIKSEINGKIVEINFQEGKPVTKNQLLVRLKSDDIKAQLKKAEERLNLLVITEKRQKKLLEKDGISQEEYDTALNELNTQKAEIEYLTAMLDKTEIRAPFSGIAGLRNISIGSFLSTNDIVTSIYKTDRLKLEFSLPQKYFNQISTGNEVTFVLPPDINEYKASVYALNPEIDPSTRAVTVRAYYQNSANKIKPGSFTEIKFNIGHTNDRIMVPTQALIPDLESEKLFLFKNGKAVPVNVKTGTRTASEIEIIEGLQVGDTVITSGIIQLRPNMDVNISIVEGK